MVYPSSLRASGKLALIGVALGGLLAGCSTIDSAKIEPARATETTVAGSGIVYFLPRQLAKVSAKRSEVSTDKAIKSLGEAELGVSTGKAQVAAIKLAIKETEDAIVSKGDIPAVRDLLTARLAEQKKGLLAADAALKKKEGDRKTAAEEVAAAVARGPSNDNKQQKVTLGIELLPPSADPRHAYRLNPRHSAFRDDEHKLSISPNGLLTSLDVTAADRTADALVELASFTGAMAGGPPGIAASDGGPCAGVPEEIVVVLDFANENEVGRLNQTLACMGARIQTIDSPPAFLPPSASRAGLYEGVVYRTPAEVVVQIEKCQVKDGKCAGWFPTAALALSLPQAGPISHIPQNAGLFTKTTYATAFKDGLLVSYNSNRPSEVLHVAATPMRLLSGFFDGASKIISLRTGQANSQVEAFTAQKKLTEAELAALQAQAKLDQLNRCISDKIVRGEPPDACYLTQ